MMMMMMADKEREEMNSDSFNFGKNHGIEIGIET